jgi:hypothetical protein
MNGRNQLRLLGAVAAFVGLVVAWPHLAATARNPVIGTWDPALDPGTRLELRLGASVETYAIGLDHNLLDVRSTGPNGYLGAWSCAYRETDGTLGHEGEPKVGEHDSNFGAPDLATHFALTGGYRDNGHVWSLLRHQDGAESKVTIGPPIDLTPGTTSDWRPLAIVWHLGVLLEWRTTADNVQIRRSVVPGASTAPKFGGGLLQTGGARGSFGSKGDRDIAGTARSRGTGVTQAATRTAVHVSTDGDGAVWTTVVVE